jgi:uncharacterized protein (TIGR02284 family)
MLSSDQKTIEIFSQLIKMNSSRIEGYSLAEKEAVCCDTIRCFFSRIVESGYKIREELNGELEKMGQVPDEGPIRNGATFWLWFDLKAADTGEQREVIFDACENAEKKILEEYKEILIRRRNELTAAREKLIRDQYGRLNEDLKKIQNLRKVFIRPAYPVKTGMESYKMHVYDQIRNKYRISLNFVSLVFPEKVKNYLMERLQGKKLTKSQKQKAPQIG